MSQNEQGRVDSMIDGDAITKLATTVLGDNTTTSTTTFTNQNPTNVLRVLSDVPHPRQISASSTTGQLQQSVSSFLSKPIAISTGSITPANLAGSSLFRFDIAPQLQSNPMWANKVAGYMNMRGTACVRLQINASPFQAGRLILCYIPQYSHSPRSFTPHLTNLMTITQLPHVEMTFQDAECELEIPYISPTAFYNKITGQYDWGTVWCYVYSPLATGSGGSTQVTYTAWLSFKDFELEVPIVPQSSGKVKAKRDIIRKYRVNAIKSNLDSEVNEGRGPISSILSNVSSIASTLYQVPMLSPIAGPTAWFTNMMSGAASAFGWSKPMLDTPVCRMFSNPHAYLANTNEPDVSNNLALVADNKVDVMPDVNLSGVDEMSHAFIKRQKSWFRTVSWSSTTLPGPLTNFTITPRTFQLQLANAPIGLTSFARPFTYSPIAFLGNLYTLWRGSIEIHVKLVKTQYHTGRLMFSLCPSSTAGTTTNLDTNYVHREVVDLRDGDEFCITVPYCYHAMYHHTSSANVDMFFNLQVSVLNELVAPETASQSIEILFEVRGGEDLEFQLPLPVRFSTIQNIEPQSGGDDSVPPILCNDIGGSSVNSDGGLASGLCIGEHSTSLLQLMKRYIRMSSSASLSAQNKFRIYPFLWCGFYSTGVVSAGSEGPVHFDYLNTFAGCYAHSRGGVRYRIVCDPVSESDVSAGSMLSCLEPHNASSQSPLSLSTATANDSLGLPSNQQPAGTLNNPLNSFDTAYAAGTGVTVPMYSRTFARLNRISYANSVSTSSPNTPLGPLNSPDVAMYALAITSTSTAFGSATSIYRCASDDFHFSFWLGVPPMGDILPS